MSLPYFIARRLSLRSVRGKAATSVVVAISGIALSVLVMLLSIAVMVGFKKEIAEKIMGFDAQLVVTSQPSDSYEYDASDVNPDHAPEYVNFDEICNSVEFLPSDALVTLSIHHPTILKTPTDFTGALLKGMDQRYDWKFVRSNLVEGVIPDYQQDSTRFHIVMSRSLKENLNLELNDKVDAFFLQDDKYKLRRLKLAGVYDTHFSEYDNIYIFCSIDMLSQLLGVSDNIGTHLEIYGLSTDKEIAECAEHMRINLLDDLYTHRTQRMYVVKDVHENSALYFNWLELLDTNVVVILSIMGLLTCLTLVSSLYVLVLRRVHLIGILKALGATNASVRKVFLVLTMRILKWGLLIGDAAALLIIFAQRHTQILPLNPEAYYLDHVPMEFNIWWFLGLNAGVVVMSYLVLILPSSIITSIPPSRVIRYD